MYPEQFFQMVMRGDWIKLVGIFCLLLLTTPTLFPSKYPATLRLVVPVGGTIVHMVWLSKGE